MYVSVEREREREREREYIVLVCVYCCERNRMDWGEFIRRKIL